MASRFLSNLKDGVMRLSRAWLCFLLSMFSLVAMAEDAQIANLFFQKKASGALILSSADGKNQFSHNPGLLSQPLSPSSTFDIVNALIFLEEALVTKTTDILEWDGNDYGNPDLNQNQVFENAFDMNCLWCFQQMAKKVGHYKYAYYFSRFQYGNNILGSDMMAFWLNGDLKISGEQQIVFLKSLYQEVLPFKNKNIKIVKNLLIEEEMDSYRLSGKQGIVTLDGKTQAWYIGYVESGQQVYFFSSLLNIKDPSQVTLPKELVLLTLQTKGLI